MRRVTPRRDGGFTLIELSVVVLLMGIIGSIAASIVVRSLDISTTSQSRTVTTGQLQTTLERISRDVRVSDPLVAAAANELTVDVQRGAQCLRQRWYVAAGQLRQDSRSRGNVPCTGTAGAPGAVATTVLVTNFDGATAGSLFRYYRVDASKQLVEVVAPTAAQLDSLERVTITVAADPPSKARPVDLTTSVDLRNVTS